MPRLQRGPGAITQLIFSRKLSFPQIACTSDVLLEVSTVNAYRKKQMAEAGVLGDAPVQNGREEMKPLVEPGQDGVTGQKENDFEAYSAQRCGLTDLARVQQASLHWKIPNLASLNCPSWA